MTSLYVANTSQGSTYNDRSHILVTAADYEAQGSDADFTLANPDHYVDVGGRKYTLADEYSGSDRNWFLQSDGLAPSGRALAGVSVIMPEIWYLEVDTLYKRIESYGTPGYEGGFWFNGAAKRSNITRREALAIRSKNSTLCPSAGTRKTKPLTEPSSAAS